MVEEALSIILLSRAALSGGSIGHKIEDPTVQFIQIITLPENFAYFGNEFVVLCQ